MTRGAIDPRIPPLAGFFSPAAWTTLAILGVVSVTLAVSLVSGQPLLGSLLLHLALIAFFGGIAWLTERHSHDAAWAKWLRAASVVGIMFTLYTTLGHVAFEAIPWMADPPLAVIDRWLFGGVDIHLALQRWYSPAVLEFLAAIYSLFIPYLYLSIFVGCVGRPAREREHFITGFALLYALSFLGYLYAPAKGPVVHHAEQLTVALEGGFFHGLVLRSIEGFGGPHGAMPSLHVGASVYACLFDWRYNRLRGLTYVPVVALMYAATVYLRYHFVIDLVAGTGLAIGAHLISQAWLRRLGVLPARHASRLTEEIPPLPWIPARLAAWAVDGDRPPAPASETESFPRWIAELLATEGRNPPALGETQAARERDARLLESRVARALDSRGGDPRFGILRDRLARYRASLDARGISQQDVFLPMDSARALFFTLRELEIIVAGTLIALWGWLTELIPLSAARSLARSAGRGPALAAFYFLHTLQFVAIFLLLTGFWQWALVLSIPFSGVYLHYYRSRIRQVLRRSRTYLHFRRHPDMQAGLIAEGHEILESLRQLDLLQSASPTETRRQTA